MRRIGRAQASANSHGSKFSISFLAPSLPLCWLTQPREVKSGADFPFLAFPRKRGLTGKCLDCGDLFTYSNVFIENPASVRLCGMGKNGDQDRLNPYSLGAYILKEEADRSTFANK